MNGFYFKLVDSSSSSNEATNSEITSSKGGEEEMMEIESSSKRKSTVTSIKSTPKLPYNAAGRGISIAVLIKDGILKPQKKCLSLEYLVRYRT